MRIYLCALSILCLCGLLSVSAAQAATRDPVTGLWRTQGGNGIVELYSCDTHICGRFWWLKDDSTGQISRDTHNRDPAKRDRPLCRMQFMGGFTPDEDQKGRYEDGWIYSPHSGATYSVEMTLTGPGTLDLRGYLLLPMFGESQIWKRVKSAPKCTTAKHE